MYNFYTNIVIDAVQNGKKEFVNHFVKHEKLSNIYKNYIEQQTEYTKKFVDGMIGLNSSLFYAVTAPKFTTELVESYNISNMFADKKAR